MIDGYVINRLSGLIFVSALAFLVVWAIIMAPTRVNASDVPAKEYQKYEIDGYKMYQFYIDNGALCVYSAYSHGAISCVRQ